MCNESPVVLPDYEPILEETLRKGMQLCEYEKLSDEELIEEIERDIDYYKKHKKFEREFDGRKFDKFDNYKKPVDGSHSEVVKDE